MTMYFIRGFSKAGVYRTTVEGDDMEKAFQLGKQIINDIHRPCPIGSWCIDREQ